MKKQKGETGGALTPLGVSVLTPLCSVPVREAALSRVNLADFGASRAEQDRPRANPWQGSRGAEEAGMGQR